MKARLPLIVCYNGCEAKVFLIDPDSFSAQAFQVSGWAIRVGTNTYTGFVSRRAALAAVSNYI